MAFDPVAFGERLRQAREQKRMTQNDLAIRSGVKRVMTISDYENGRRKKPDLETLARVAETLGVTLEWLMDGDSGQARVEASENPDPQALRDFLDSPFGDDVTPEELERLRAIPMDGGKPTVRAYHHALMMIRELY